MTIEAQKAVPSYETISQWRDLMGIDVSRQVKLVRLSHMRYQHKDIESITTFLKGMQAAIVDECVMTLTDFGMSIVKEDDNAIWWGGYGPDPYVYVVEKGEEKKFLGGVYLVESYAELERYAFCYSRKTVEVLTLEPGQPRSLVQERLRNLPTHQEAEAA